MGCRIQLRRRRQTGSLVIELAFAAIFFSVFAYLTADMCYVLYGASFNDRACRDAARAAAQTTNLTDAQKKVKAVLLAHQGPPSLLSGPTLCSPIVYQDFAGSPPVHTSPFVSVSTATSITLPFAPITFLGGCELGGSGKVSFNQTYTFPIVRLK